MYMLVVTPDGTSKVVPGDSEGRPIVVSAGAAEEPDYQPALINNVTINSGASATGAMWPGNGLEDEKLLELTYTVAQNTTPTITVEAEVSLDGNSWTPVKSTADGSNKVFYTHAAPSNPGSKTYSGNFTANVKGPRIRFLVKAANAQITAVTLNGWCPIKG